MALNFMIHCGGAHVERGQLVNYEAPAPTQSYKPIQHLDYANMVMDTIEGFDFRIGEEGHAVGRSGNHYFGMAELRYADSEDDFALVTGWRSSYDKTLSAGFVVGSQVFVCDNLCFSGDINIGRKHTTNILADLPSLLWNAVAQIVPMRDRQLRRINAYKEEKVSDSNLNDLVVEAYREGVIPARQVGPVIDQFYAPKHEEFVENGRTLWTAFNGFTEILKGSSIWNLPERTSALHTLCDKSIKLDDNTVLEAA